jgi:DNA mismatch endonuclease (patch repair protein)
MPDVFTKSKRSEVMSLIRSTGNRETELRLISLFREQGITGWRRGKTLRLEETGKRKLETGKEKSGFKTIRPDFVFPDRKIAVFVDG